MTFILHMLKHIGTDLRRGENVDLFSTIGIVLVILALDVFGITDQNAISVAILMVLGLVAVNLLVTRYQLTDIQRASGGSDTVRFFVDKDPKLIKDIERSNEIWMLGLQLKGTTQDNFYLLQRKASQGASFRIMICDPNKLDKPSVSKRFARGVSPQQFATEFDHVFDHVIEQYRDISRSSPMQNAVQLRLLDIVPSASLYIFPNTDTGIIYVETYGYRSSLGSMPKFRISRYEHPQWYEFFRDQFDLMWNDAQPSSL